MGSERDFTPPYVLAIDAGTEATKAGLVDSKGSMLALGTRACRTDFPRPGWAEQNPQEWWVNLVGAVHDCLADAQIDPRDIAGMCADATTSTLVPLGQDGSALRPAFLWMDVRATAQARRIFASGHEALRYCPAGVNAEWMAPKALWFKENEPELYAKTRYLLEYTDWIALRLTGRYTLNINTATQRWFYHLPSGGWPSGFFSAIGLDGIEEKFPSEILKVGDMIGPLLPRAADELGLRAGIPVATGGGDAFIALLGQGVTEPGEMGIVMGSSNVISSLTAQGFYLPGIFGSFPDALIPGLNLVEAGQVSTGSILSWFRRNFARDLEVAERGISPYDALDREAAEVPIGSDGLIALDYFQGNRTPHTDPFARGAIWGLSLHSSRGHVFRALMEGIAYGLRDILDTLGNHGLRAERIIVSGGATRSELFMQIYADVLGVPLNLTAEPEASLLGSAVAAAVGAKIFPDLPTASKAMVSVAGGYQPDPVHHAQYSQYVKYYRETYRLLKEQMQEMQQMIDL